MFTIRASKPLIVHTTLLATLLLLLSKASLSSTTATTSGHCQPHSTKNNRWKAGIMVPRQPILFLSHGGGPCFFMNGAGSPFAAVDKDSKVTKQYKQLATKHCPEKPSAIIVVSAHWEGAKGKIEVTGSANPGLLYDYYGFPKETYAPYLTYDAVGNPELASSIVAAMNKADLPATLNTERAFDHGVFIPLKLLFPEADIPIVQVSLHSSLDPELHTSMGQVLGKLLNSNPTVLLVASGQATHNMQATRSGPQAPGWATQFVDWMKDTSMTPAYTSQERIAKLHAWADLPSARQAHPREEHLIPYLVAVAASTVRAAPTAERDQCEEGGKAGEQAADERGAAIDATSDACSPTASVIMESWMAGHFSLLSLKWA
eukprot:m.308989 g.308989  ORF g.308989 m.308989 type:complete len:374 (-) comp15944_c0_seq3:1413-2534(-)